MTINERTAAVLKIAPALNPPQALKIFNLVARVVIEDVESYLDFAREHSFGPEYPPQFVWKTFTDALETIQERLDKLEAKIN
jgi:hypothetical protein